MGLRAVIAVPLFHDGRPVGVIGVSRDKPGPFSERQVGLLRMFADQAVIAIENTRLFEEVQARTKELQDSLERQTATSEVLGVISRSPNEVQPVLDTIVATAQRLCQAERAVIWRLEGETFRAVAHHGTPEERVESLYSARMPLSRGTMIGRATLARRAVQVEDGATDPELSAAAHVFARAGNVHTILAVPLLLKGHPIGGITLQRTRVAPFDDKQVALVESFADQAVIAIENSRLFEAEQASKRELTESLEQQTATADVLKVISRSALDVQKVLDALVESAARLCDAYDAAILQVDGNGHRLVAHHGQIPMMGPVGQLTIPLERGSIGTRAGIDRRTIHVADMLAAGDEYPDSRQRALRLGYRTALAVPLVHAGEAIGYILIRRSEVRPFTERQIELVNTFADQAVIAIENSRLFEEVQARTRELAKTVEDLEIASQHKNQFVANMSHELRTPLAAILGYAELIQEGFYEPQGPKSLDALTRIRSNGKHLLGLINTVLDIAKIESGQFTLNMSEYAIESVVETVRAATESLAQNKKLALTTAVDKSLPIGLGDEQSLTQVLLNLVGNAIKFTDAGEVIIAAGARNGHFAVSVTDTGPGIPLDQQDRIFEQFHQVDSSNTKAKGGTGLGLAIAKQIVEMHGGRIWVISTPGKGSTFQMELPTRAEFRKRI
jgi:signal transduction histidine kinase